ncbi:hypothetical protein B0H14DRAFT_2567896 [Mycena olivaceomarginata]|nr:hypothetical protein B0H14DRAFT_2567896 [Mycena olivaceomarginata]
MDLVNDENLDINSPTDIAALEEMWFNAPDPYDLSEADRCPPDAPFVMRSTSRFEISGYVKLDSPGLSELILLGSSRKYGPLKGTVTEFPSTCYASFTASAVYTAIRQLKCGVFLCCNADIIRLGLDPESKQSLESKSMLRIRVLPGGCSVNPWDTVGPILNRFS